MVRAALLALLLCAPALAAQAGSVRCDRASFGSFIQSNYRDLRFRVLVAQAAGPLEYRTSGRGRLLVVRGSWVDPYTGRLFRNVPARTMEIDHVIPVCWAWAHGADRWDRQMRRRFYNDRRYLLAVEAGLNRQKGAQGPDRFVPLNRAFACSYVELFLDGISQYRLHLAPDEAVAIEQSRAAACGVSPTG